jgi:hypothetical protein
MSVPRSPGHHDRPEIDCIEAEDRRLLLTISMWHHLRKQGPRLGNDASSLDLILGGSSYLESYPTIEKAVFSLIISNIGTSQMISRNE